MRNAWSNPVLLATFGTFRGAQNYHEHVQIPELSKGTILDAVIRPVAYQDDDGKTAAVNYVDILVATNKNLKDEMIKGRFREDLFYRLNVVHIHLPSLKQRQEDIRLLVNHFIKKYSSERKSDIAVTGVDQEVDRLFYDYSWPGNVRELENVIERVMILCPGDTVTVSDLPKGFKDSVYNTLHLEGIPANAKLSDTLAMIEKTMIERALKMANNVQAHAAEMLGIGKSGLNQKLKKYNLDIGPKTRS